MTVAIFDLTVWVLWYFLSSVYWYWNLWTKQQKKNTGKKGRADLSFFSTSQAFSIQNFLINSFSLYFSVSLTSSSFRSLKSHLFSKSIANYGRQRKYWEKTTKISKILLSKNPRVLQTCSTFFSLVRILQQNSCNLFSWFYRIKIHFFFKPSKFLKG